MSRTVVALSGLQWAGGQFEPWYGGVTVLGKSTAVDRETDGKGE